MSVNNSFNQYATHATSYSKSMLRWSIVDVMDPEGNVVANRIELSFTAPLEVLKLWHAWTDRIKTASV